MRLQWDVFRRFSPGALVIGLAFAAGCGTSSVNTTPVATATPTPTATPISAPPIPAATAFTATQSQILSIPAPPATGTAPPLAVALPPGGGITSNLGIPLSQASIPPNTAISVTTSNTLPASVPALFSGRRPQAQGTVATIEIVELIFSNQVILPAPPTFAFTVPATFILPNTSYYVAQFDPAYVYIGWNRGFEGPGTVDATNTVSFTGLPGSYIFQANEPQYFAFYAVSAAAATPSPAPVPTQAPTPPPLSASPASISLLAIGASTTVSIADAATSYTGGYTATSGNTAVATATISGTTVTITGVATGSTIVTIATTDGRQLLIPVGVTSTTVPVQ